MSLLNELQKKDSSKVTFVAPETVSKPKGFISIFLAGSIEMDKAIDWQESITKKLHKAFDDIIVLNPRRKDWDSSWTQEITDKNFYGQVDWEHTQFTQADIVLIFFQKGTKSPISLMELGICAERFDNGGADLIVCCEEGFWRKGNVDYICEKYGIDQIKSLDELVDLLKKNNPPLKRK